jgi:hypothetical protein
VSQISPPIRILLVCVVAFMGVYMLFMRPKDEAIPPADPAPNTQTSEPAVSEPGKVAEAAQDAVEASNSQLAQQESVDGVDAEETAAGATTATGTETAPKTGEAAAVAAGVDLNGIPKSIAKAIRRDKTLVLLFWNRKSADDKAVHEALADVNRWDGRVFVASASIKKIAAYGRIARGVDVEQSPTVVVADTQLRAETLVGYVDAKTIDQAVVDAFRNTDGLFTDAYLKKIDAVCVEHSNQAAAIPNYYFTGDGDMAKLDTRLTAYHNAVRDFQLDFAAVKAPKKWAGFRKKATKELDTIEFELGVLSAAVQPTTTRANLAKLANSYSAAAKKTGDRLNDRFDAQGLLRCGSAW